MRRVLRGTSRRKFLGEEKEKEKEECRVHFRMIFGTVTQIVKMSDPMTKSPGAEAALMKEINVVLEKQALDLGNIEEEDEVKARDPTAEFVDGDFIAGIKNHELDESEWQWKFRFVVRGNNVVDVFGSQVQEEVLQETPVAMPETRYAYAHAAAQEDGVSLHGDVEGAYLTSDLGGNPRYLRLRGRLREDPRVIPRNMQYRLRKPCVRIRKAFYGFKRSGADFGAHFKKKMKSLKLRGWVVRKVRDVTSSVWIIGPVLIIVYVDDVSPHGPRKETYEVSWLLDALLGVSEKSKKNPELHRFVGIERSIPVTRADGCKESTTSARGSTRLLS